MPDNVIIELQFLEKLSWGMEQQIQPGTISAIFYSKHFGYKCRYILGPEYVLDLTQDTLQLYRDSKKNLTFVWLKATDRKAVKGRWNKRVDDEVVNSLSVDLQRFNRNILAGSRRHPLVNKTPFVKMELFAQNFNSSEYPYWDSFDANDILPVPEIPEAEAENGEEYRADFVTLFPCETLNCAIDSDESLVTALNLANENPYHFKDVLEKGQGICAPQVVSDCFVKLLKHMTAVVAPEMLPDGLQQLLTEIVAMVNESMMVPVSILSAASLLQRLGLSDVASQLVQKPYTEGLVTFQSFLVAVEDWQSCWYLNANTARIFLQQLSSALNSHALAITSETPQVCLRQAYLQHLGLLHVLALLDEVSEVKEKIMSDIASSKESQTSVSFLKIARSSTDECEGIYFYRTSALEQKLRITQGQYVSIQRQNTRSFPLIIGQVHSMSLAPFHMTLKSDGRVLEYVLSAIRSEGIQYFRADLIGNIVTYQRVVAAMKHLDEMNSVSSVFNFIASSMEIDGQPESNAVVDKVTPIPVEHTKDFEELNEKQQEAVSTSLTRNICLIQGPPGTGKTTVACHIVREIISSRVYTGVMVVGETNVAVDNLARRLRNDTQIVRIGTGEGVAEDLYDSTLEEHVKRLAEKEAKRAVIRDQHGDPHRNTRLIKQVLSAADVVLATCAGAGDPILASCRFDFVLVDEATLTMETTLLCALAHGVKHLVLIGDHKQLGPVIPESVSPNGMNFNHDLPSPNELSSTLFHRLIDSVGVPSCFLETQHRMHPDIMKFPSEEIYDGRLRAGKCVHNRLESKFPWPQMKPYKPVCFVNVEHREFRRGTSYFNIKENEVVKKIVDVLLRVDEETLREYRIGVNQIAVLTLYQAQVTELKSKINKGVAVSSVDGFQGQERDVIVVSTVRCNTRRAVGFSGDAQRINVLLTRAKRGLIIVGNAETLKASDIWDRWLQQAPVLRECDILPLNLGDTKGNRTDDARQKRPMGRRTGHQKAGK